MNWVRFVTIVVLSALLSTGIVSAAPLDQTPDAPSLLNRSSQALSNVESFRVEGAIQMATSSRGSSATMSFSMNGEFSTPDRAHLSLDLGAMGFDLEAIVIGQEVWLRSGGDAWESISGQMSEYLSPTTSPSFTTMPSQDIGQYLRDARVVEDGASYRISGTIDFDRVMAGFTPPPSFASEFGTSPGMPDLSKMDASFVYVIDRASLYPSSMEVSVVLPADAMPTTPRGTASAPSDVTVTVRLTYRDFNDPSIRIDPPA